MAEPEDLQDWFLRLAPLDTSHRHEVLEREFAGDPDERRKLLRLLAAHDASRDDDAFLSPLVERPVIFEEPLPTRIGPYTIESLLGEGGMARVYRARQSLPVDRVVALKVLKRSFEGPEDVGRFRAERQALATLQHGNVARVLDVGWETSGVPYFAMELVDGPPITEYVEERALDPEDRLRLFVAVCRGVQHAHAHGILHRDLKPVNILVATEDGRPVPKIIDFGIAKALDADSPIANRTATIEHRIVGTLRYMSPEQADFDRPRMDVRSDVYSLGVVLFEMMTGEHPLGIAPDDSRSSTRLRDLVRTAPPRRSSEFLVTRRFRDLDAILRRALAKDPEERYATVSEFADDVVRLLEGRPLVAREFSVWNTALKFANRHRRWMLYSMAFLLVTILGLLGTTLAWIHAERTSEDLRASLARERTQEAELRAIVAYQTKALADIDLTALGSSMRERLLEEFEERGEELRERMEIELRSINFTNVALHGFHESVLGTLEAGIETGFAEDSCARSALLQGVATIALHQGLLDLAEPVQERALALRRRHLGEEDEETARSWIGWSGVRRARGDYQDAKHCAQRAVDILTRRFGAWAPATLEAWEERAAAATALSEWEYTEELLRKVLDRRLEVHGREHRETLRTMASLGSLLVQRNTLDEGERWLREALEGRSEVLGETHRDTLHTRMSLGALLYRKGKHEEALACLEPLEPLRALLGDAHPTVWRALDNRAVVLQALGRFEEAVSSLQEVLEARRTVLGDDHPDTCSSRVTLGTVFQRMGRLDEAFPLLRAALEGYQNHLGPTHGKTLLTHNALGAAYTAAEDHERAVAHYRAAYEGRLATLSADHADTLISQTNLAGALAGTGQLEEGLTLMREALERGRRVHPPDHWHLGMFGHQLAKILLLARRFEEAEREGLEAHRLLAASLGSTHGRTLALRRDIAAILDQWHAAEPEAGHAVRARSWREPPRVR